MPEIPAFLARRAERWMGLASTVSQVEQISNAFRRVRFAGEALIAKRCDPGYVIEFRVHEGALRHYSVCAFNSAAGELDVLFYLHGKGPGSNWASNLQLGQEAFILGPGSDGLGIKPTADWHLFLGDETAVGAFHMMSSALPRTTRIIGAVEALAGEEPTVAKLLPRIGVVTRQATPGQALATWLTANALPPGQGAAYLVGHQQSVRSQYNQLVARGMDKKNIKIKPFWADGRRGL